MQIAHLIWRCVALLWLAYYLLMNRTILCYCLCYGVILHTRRASRRKRQAQTQIPAVNERRAAARSTRNEPVHGSRPWTRLPFGPWTCIPPTHQHPPPTTAIRINQRSTPPARATPVYVHRPLGRFAHTRLPPMRCHAPPGTNANANAISAAARARARNHPPTAPAPRRPIQVRVHWAQTQSFEP